MASTRVRHEQTYQKLKWLSRRMFAVTVPQVSLAAKLAAAESDKQELVAQLAQAQVGVGQESRGGVCGLSLRACYLCCCVRRRSTFARVPLSLCFLDIGERRAWYDLVWCRRKSLRCMSLPWRLLRSVSTPRPRVR